MKNKAYPLYNDFPHLNTIREMVEVHASLHPDHIAFKYPITRKTTGQKSYLEVKEDMEGLGTYFYTHDLYDKHIAILGENCYEWLISYFTITGGNNVAVPIDKDLQSKEVKRLIENSDTQCMIISDTYLDLIEGLELEIIPFSRVSELIEMGKEKLKEGNKAYLDYRINPNKLCSIFFTSGTTGKAKAVMLSHTNIVNVVNQSCAMLHSDGGSVSVLPFHHTLGLIPAIFGVYNYGHPIYLTRSLRTLNKDLIEYKPHILFFVPLIVETFYSSIQKEIKKQGKEIQVKRAMKISDLALKLGIDLRAKLFKELLAPFGGELKVIICGGASLDEDLVKTFYSWGITILNGYGITECAPVIAVNRNLYHKNNSVGLLLPEGKVKISEEGEILYQGNNVMMGYYKDEQETRNAIIDGYYHTGDLGYIDQDHFLYLTGRKKNLIILSNGENLSPELLEEKIKMDQGVKEVIVYSEQQKIKAMIYPKETYLDQEDYFNELITRINHNEPAYKQISQIVLRKKEFIKNSSQKIIRDKIWEE